MEEDVQEISIRGIEAIDAGQKLEITDERDRKFQVDLARRQVTEVR